MRWVLVWKKLLNNEVISFDHTHLMSHAITSTSTMGFILRDLNQEFAARIANELLLSDKKVKALGSNNILNRAKLGALIGEGNGHFLQILTYWACLRSHLYHY